MSTAVTDAEKKLFREVRSNSEAYELLQDKARWEGVSLYGVLREWGDPRSWPSSPAEI